ncbi:MAG: AAA family ATPase [Candidatus Omnitrophota bacterium]
MKIKKIIIHNFRSIIDAEFSLNDYTMLVGKNNSGKTNIMAAIRIFYEDGGLKYSEKRDFPKLKVKDQDSWVEIHYATTNDEQRNLKEDYQTSDNILKVRKYLQSKDFVKAGQSNLYAYEKGGLSGSLFYGAKNISQAKLGKIIFIPAVSKTEDTFKLSGPSPFRDILNFVMKRAVIASPSFETLKNSFDNFNDDFREESSKDGFSINNLVDDINEDIKNWQVSFGITINSIKPDDIVKNLLSHYLEDNNLTEKQVEISHFGQGLQRHLIYTLIRLSSKYIPKEKSVKKEWLPDLVVLLFEEPEAFLHPSQQEVLHLSLQTVSFDKNEQVLISSHSPHFVSKKMDDISGVVRLHKNGGVSRAHQINKQDFSKMLSENISLYKVFCEILNDSAADSDLKKAIKKNHLGEHTPDETMKLEEESIRYFLWLNPDKSSLFFAEHVIICEGLSDKVLFDLILDERCFDLRSEKHIYVLESGGKFNIHRYVTLLDKLCISHSVIIDKDENRSYHEIVNNHIEQNRSQVTKEIYFFEDSLEKFLNISIPKRKDLKPINIVKLYKNNSIGESRINELIKIIKKCI